MTKLPRDIKPHEMIKLLKRIGFIVIGKRGSHLRFKHSDGRWTQIAVHPGPIPLGTLKAILVQMEISVDDLIKLL